MTTERERMRRAGNALPVLHETFLPREHSLYRPRHADRQRVALVCAIVFFLLPAIAFVFGVRPAAFENRRLAGFPSLLAGWSFFPALSPWATDQLPLREQAVHAEDWLSRDVFGEPPAYRHGDQALSPLPQDTSVQPPPSEYPTVLEGKNGWMYLGAELASHCRQAEPIGTIVTRLRELAAGVTASGRQFVLVIAPDKTTMVPQYLPDSFPGKQCLASSTTAFWQAMSRLSYVVDLRATLRTWGQQLGAPVYGPQDAHWSDEGGVAMARGLAERLLPGISRGWVIQPGASWQQPADLPPLIGQSGTTSGRHYAILPDGVHDQTHPVPTNYDAAPVHFGTASGPGTFGLGVGLIADSFTIRAAPYLASVFGDMKVVHEVFLEHDDGAAVGQMLASESVVAVEVAERTLVTGQYDLLDPAVESTILGQLASHPIR